MLPLFVSTFSFLFDLFFVGYDMERKSIFLKFKKILFVCLYVLKSTNEHIVKQNDKCYRYFLKFPLCTCVCYYILILNDLLT